MECGKGKDIRGTGGLLSLFQAAPIGDFVCDLFRLWGGPWAKEKKQPP